MPVAEMNEAILQAIEEHVFTPEAVEQVIALTSGTSNASGRTLSASRPRMWTGASLG
jgi:hypothetical protein